jgi:hypothetical protein
MQKSRQELLSLQAVKRQLDLVYVQHSGEEDTMKYLQKNTWLVAGPD